jgi:hypothetical protein
MIYGKGPEKTKIRRCTPNCSIGKTKLQERKSITLEGIGYKKNQKRVVTNLIDLICSVKSVLIIVICG